MLWESSVKSQIIHWNKIQILWDNIFPEPNKDIKVPLEEQINNNFLETQRKINLVRT